MARLFTTCVIMFCVIQVGIIIHLRASSAGVSWAVIALIEAGYAIVITFVFMDVASRLFNTRKN